jgi:hypothetical protein
VISSATDICDSLVLALKILEKTELAGGSLGDARAELERCWLEIAFVENTQICAFSQEQDELHQEETTCL